MYVNKNKEESIIFICSFITLILFDILKLKIYDIFNINLTWFFY